MLTLFHAPNSRSSRLVWLIEEIGAEAKIEYCEIRRQDGSGAVDPNNPHPDGKVPALIHDDGLVTESVAVAQYLVELFPRANLAPAPGAPDRGTFLTWMAWVPGEFEPALWDRMSGRTDTDPRLVARYDQAMSRLLEALWTGPWLMGESFTAVDIMVGSALLWARPHLPESPLFDLYLERLAQRPALIRALARDTPELVATAA